MTSSTVLIDSMNKCIIHYTIDGGFYCTSISDIMVAVFVAVFVFLIIGLLILWNNKNCNKKVKGGNKG